MPTYNSAQYILKSIQSVEDQTFSNWELIIIDDCSTDDSFQIIQESAKKDHRIRWHRLEKNSGAAVARNKGVEMAKGEFLAFLDSDDLWHPQKLEKQLRFMTQNGYLFSSTDYEFVDEQGIPTGKVMRSFPKLDYDGLLKYGPGNSTIMYWAQRTGKQYVADIRKRNDYLMWLGLIKKTKYLHGINEILTQYRIRPNSLSENKVDLIKYHWYIYRKLERLGICKSTYLILFKTFTTLFPKENV